MNVPEAETITDGDARAAVTVWRLKKVPEALMVACPTSKAVVAVTGGVICVADPDRVALGEMSGAVPEAVTKKVEVPDSRAWPTLRLAMED